MNKLEAAKRKAEWLLRCLDFGWKKEDLDGLSEVWDKFRDENGNDRKLPESPSHPKPGIVDQLRGENPYQHHHPVETINGERSDTWNECCDELEKKLKEQGSDEIDKRISESSLAKEWDGMGNDAL